MITQLHTVAVKFLILLFHLLILFIWSCQENHDEEMSIIDANKEIETHKVDCGGLNIPALFGHAYIEGEESVGVVLCHGRDKYPTWYVVNPLRIGITENLNYHTLSLQMPHGGENWDEYLAIFSEAHRRISEAICYLQEAKNVTTIYLMGHSMGGRMATSYLADHPDSDIAGFIGVGMRNRGGIPLDSDLNLRSVTVPVLDVYGNGGDGLDAEDAATRSDMISICYEQVVIQDANHIFKYHEGEMVSAVVDWLAEKNSTIRQLKKQCALLPQKPKTDYKQSSPKNM